MLENEQLACVEGASRRQLIKCPHGHDAIPTITKKVDAIYQVEQMYHGRNMIPDFIVDKLCNAFQSVSATRLHQFTKQHGRYSDVMT